MRYIVAFGAGMPRQQHKHKHAGAHTLIPSFIHACGMQVQPSANHLLMFIEVCTTAPGLGLLVAVVLPQLVVVSMDILLFTSCLIQQTCLLDTNVADILPRVKKCTCRSVSTHRDSQ